MARVLTYGMLVWQVPPSAAILCHLCCMMNAQSLCVCDVFEYACARYCARW